MPEGGRERKVSPTLILNMASNCKKIDKKQKAEKTLSSVINDECSCPVCFEDFLEPKSLPNCAHNVCRKCLEAMTADGASDIRCPVCRKESNVPEEGVNGLPTNRLIVKLLEATPGRIERREIRRCLENVQEELESVERGLRKLEVQKQERKERGLAIKYEITNAGARLVELVKKYEQELCSKVDELLQKDMEILGYEKRKEECDGVQKELQDFVSKTERTLKEGNAATVMEIKEKLVLEGKEIKIRARKIYTEEPDSLILLARFVELEVLERSFGKVKTGTEADFDDEEHDNLSHMSHTNGAAIRNKSASMNSRDGIDSCTLAAPELFDLTVPVFQYANIARTIFAGDLGLEVLSPVAIASNSSTRDIAVAEPDNNRILVVSSQGRLKKRVYSGSVPYSGITFSGDGEIIAVYSAKELVFIDPKTGKTTGNFKTTDHGVRHRSVTCDQTGRFIVTSEPSSMFYKSSVCVYGNSSSHSQRAVLKFTCYGSSLTSSPFKALYHRGEYFVSDTAKGCIMVYNEQGGFLRQFGAWGSLLRRGNGRGRGECGELTSPTGIVLDQSGENLLVCDVNTKSIQMYTTAGQFVGKYVMEGRPSDVTVLRDGTIVVCSKADHWIKFLSLNDPEL